MDTFVMLEELLEQDQFELLPAKEGDTERRLVYLMNDAVESFLVFRGAALTGHYLEDYEGALTWSMSRDAARYVLVVRQGDNAVTLLFENLDLEVHLYNYGEIAHFWVPGYEYLRQLEYRIAILRDKCEYLGLEYCTEEERKLAPFGLFPAAELLLLSCSSGEIHRADSGAVESFGRSVECHGGAGAGMRK